LIRDAHRIALLQDRKGFNRSDAALKSLSPESFMPAIMTVQAFRNTSECEHLLGDVPALVGRVQES
jgi:hypothetical protein